MKKTIFYVLVALAALGVLYFGGKSILESKSKNSSSTTSATDYMNLGDSDTEFTYKPMKEDELDFTVESYPDAKIITGENSYTGEVNFNGQNTKVATYSTKDTVDEVSDFYKSALGAGATINTVTYSGLDIKVVTSKNNTGPMVEIYKENALTYIKIIER